MPEDKRTEQPAARRQARWIDALVFVVLILISGSHALRYTHGDLWLDEADYAIAGLHSIQDNRWDASDKPGEPKQLIELRHYHAPATALILRFARKFGAAEETLRLPFVAAGAVSVGLVYLCGIALFGGRREIAAGCALLIAITPANVRMASHAVPWAFITLELLGMLLATIHFAQTRKSAAMGWIGVASGLLFVTSEVFFVAAAAEIAALLVIFAPEISAYLRGNTRDKDTSSRHTPSSTSGLNQHNLIQWAALCGGAFIVIAIVVWPAGVRGHCITMLRHYVVMRTSEAFPVNIGNRVYKIAPRWAYLYWYWNFYRPFFLCYAAGVVSVAAAIVYRMRKAPQSAAFQGNAVPIDRRIDPNRLPAGLETLFIFTVVLLAAAHRAHIIGAEYLADCLPFLTLCAGYVLVFISYRSRIVSSIALAAAAIVFVRWTPSRILPGMDARTQVSRWKHAAAWIAPRWKPNDRLLLGPQSFKVAYWYLHEYAGVPLQYWQVGPFNLAGPGRNFLHNLSIGKYRWVVVSSQFEDNDLNAVDYRSMEILDGWDRVFESHEKSSGEAPRLIVFRCPISAFADTP